jgi:gliding motility-associated-like protein
MNCVPSGVQNSFVCGTKKDVRQKNILFNYNYIIFSTQLCKNPHSQSLKTLRMIQKNTVEVSTHYFSKIISALAAVIFLALLCAPVQKASAQACFPPTCGIPFTIQSIAPCTGTPTMNLGVLPPNFTCVTPDVSRVGNCCTNGSPDRCLHFIFTIGANVAAVKLEFVCGAIPNGSLFGQLTPDPVGNYPFAGCGVPFTINNLGCVTTPGTWHLTFCKPGNNVNQYRITTVGRPTSMLDDTVRVGCFDTLTYAGVNVTGSTWTSIFPGVAGQYNSYLSAPFGRQPDGSSSVVVTPPAGAPAFVDYRVCGTAIASACLTGTFCDTIRVFFYSSLTANINPDPARFCAAQGGITLTGSATGGLPPYIYTWRNSSNVIVDNDSIYFATTPGTYRLFVGDQLLSPSACNTVVDTVVVTLDSIAVSQTHVNASCNGVCDGSIDLTVTSAGGGPYSYIWSDIGPGPQDRNSLCNGTYTVTVSSGGGACVTTATITITQPATFAVVIDSVRNAGCNGEATGAIYSHTVGGTGPFSFIWSNGFTTANIINVVSGMYCVTATDAHGCVDTACAFVDQPAVLVPLITSVDINGNNVSCYGFADDTSCANPIGGTPPYSYMWTPSSLTSQCVIGQGGGILICVTVTDANGCTGDTCKIITQPDSLWLSVDDISSFICGYEISCNGNTDGFLDITTHGGTPPFCYDWSNIPGGCPVDEGEDQASLGAGTYTVTVTDANGCSSSISATLTEPAVVYDSIVSPLTPGGYNIQCYGECNGKIYSNVTGGCPPYTFTWTPNVSSTDSAVNLCAGAYMLTVTDVNGCSFTDTLTVTQPDTVLALITVVILNAGNPVSCHGVCDGTAYVTASGGSPPYTYTWSYPPLSSPTFSPAGDSIYAVCAGPISILVADVNGCSASDNNAITEPPLLTASVSVHTYNGGWNVTCNGVCDGFATVTPAGGTLPYSYLWCNGSTTATSSATLCAGPCAVTVTDGNGCDTTITFTLTEPPVLTVSLTPLVRNCGFNISCNGACDGEITANPVGGTAPYSYTWSSACTTQTCTGLCAIAYTVTVTDDNGCTATASVTLTQPTPVVIPPLTADTCVGGWNICCNSDTTGNIHTFPSGGCLPYTYLWSNGDLDSLANDVSVFTYFVTVTDANGCVAHSDTILLTEPPPVADTIVVSLFDTVNISCNGACDGTATAVSSGGTAPYHYVWSTVPVQTTQTATGLCAGTYTVLVTDTNGCSIVDTVTLSEPPLLTVSLSSTTVSCNAGCTDTLVAFPVGGIGPYTYCWTPPGPPCPNGSDTLFNACIGTYTVTVTDVNGCTATASIAPAGSAVVITVAITDRNYNGWDEPCNGNCLDTLTATPSNGAGPYTYLWSNTAVTQTIVNICAGTYTVTVTDANGCSGTASYTVTEPPVLAVNLSSTNLSCNVTCNDTITATVTGGTPGFSYVWSPAGPNSPTYPGACIGTYVVTVTDANGCTASDTIILVSSPVAINVSMAPCTTYAGGWNVTCHGACNGCITATPTTGQAPYTYLWSNAQTTQTATALCAGTYTVTVTDFNGCTGTASYTVTEPPVLSVSITLGTFNGGWNVSCNGACDGTATANPAGGTPTYTYLWSNTQVTQGATGLCATTYTVTVTDANGCTATASATLTQPPVLVIDSIVAVQYNGWNEPCNGDALGQATVYASGGTTLYSYLWSNLDATQTTTNTLTATTYTVTVTDANGCTVTGSITLTEPPLLTVTIAVDTFPGGWNVSCNGSCDGQATATASGGTPLYSYLWSNTQSTPIATGLCATTYTVTATDANGCTASASVTLTQPPPVAVTIALNTFNGGWNVSCKGSCDGQATATASGGTPGYTYLWSNGNTTQTTTTGLCATTYTVTATDVNGCTASASATLTEPPSLADSINVSQLNPPYNTTCPHACDAWMDAVVFGGTPAYTYLWNTIPPQTTAHTDSTICDTSAFGTGTVYTITVTDANGCMITDSVTITDPYQPIAILQTPSMDICDTIAVTLVADTPLPIYNGWWTVTAGTARFSPDTVSTTVTVTGLSYGDNIITWWVGDTACLAFDTILIRVYEPVNANAGSYSPICQEDEPIRLHADTAYVGVGMWSVITDTISMVTFDNPYDPTTYANHLGWGANTFQWTVTNGVCRDSARTSILKQIPEVCDSTCLEMPTAFSPNGDLFNDVFVIHCIEYSFNRENNFKVFNRWGNLVYEKNNYHNEWYGQNNTGDENAGKPLPDGTYFVILSINKSTRYPEGRILYNYVDLRR